MNAETFNALYPVGTPVFAYPGARPEDIPSARRIVTRTRTKAQPVGLDREGVVWVEDHGAYIALTHVDVVEEAEWKAAQTADTVRELGALPMPAGPVLRNSSVIPLPSNWSCAYGASDDEPFCTDDGDEHVCPTIRVHRDDAEQFAALVARVHELEGERDRFKAAWASARFRAQAYGEGIQRVVKDREQYQVWLKQAEENYAAYRGGAEAAKQMLANRINAVLDICDREERNAMRWQDPIPVPEWVAPVQRAALGDDKRSEATS